MQTLLKPEMEEPEVEESEIEEEAEPSRWKLNVAAFNQLHRAGAFEGRRVELIEGEIVEMSPIELPHWVATNRVDEKLKQIFGMGQGYIVSVQSAIQFGDFAAPEPDVAVIKADLNSLTEVPSSAVLVVEVSDTTLSYDRNRKAALYASRGIEDYWIVNLRAMQLEVMRQPRPTPNAKWSHGYALRQILDATQNVAPLELPQVSIAVADLLPALP